MSSMAPRAAAALCAAAAQGRRSASTAAAAEKLGLRAPRGEFLPVCVALGMIAVSVSLGLATARQQLEHAPNVRLDKKKREAVLEVAAPDLALDEGERFVGASIFRKVAHVQDDRSLAAGVADYPKKAAVTLKDVGVDPPGIEQGREGILDKIMKKNNA